MILNDWLQVQCRKLFLRGMQVNARIGIHDFEKAAPQRLIVDVDLYVLLEQSSPAQDSIDEVVDYDFVRAAVAERVARGPIQLQETLVDDLLTTLMQHPQVAAARVSSRKPDVYPDCDAVGVESFRYKAP